MKNKKVKSIKWCNRSLINNNIDYTIATSPELLIKELKRLKIYSDLSVPDDGAATHFFTRNGMTIAIVCLFNLKFDRNQIFALMVHEAVHVWQQFVEFIGESNPSKEFEAYAIQTISQNLFDEFNRQQGIKR